MAEELYLRLFRELNASRFESSEATAAIDQLGPPARVLRSLARARRHGWISARNDLRAAVEDPRELPAIVEFVAGVGLFVVRDYDLALTTLMRAAGRGKPGITKHARSYALRFARALGWAQRVRELSSALHEPRTPASTPDHQASPESAAAQAYALAFDRGPAAAATALDALLERDPEHPAIVAARIRLELLCERPEAARARLLALGPELREQLPGERAAAALALGDAKEATIRTIHHRDQPRLMYLRARALASLGEVGEASELLERARIVLPGSVAIVLALALARHQQAPDTLAEGLERRFEDLLEWAPALLSDAAAELSIALWTDQGPLSDRADKVAILTRAQRMLTAEADLVRPSYTRQADDGEVRLRHVVPNPMRGQDLLSSPSHLRVLHDGDRELIDHIDGALVRALGVKPPRPKVMQADPSTDVRAELDVWQPRTLSPEQIEQFLVDGFLIVPKAFDPALAKAWRDDANRRIRDEPERWVRGYDPNDETRSLRHYSPDDPSTWTWDRVNLDGPLSVPIEQFAPKAWAVICDLLGGPQRIETRTWTNYLVINFWAEAHLEVATPKPDSNSWHIDDPSPVTRLDRIQNGLVGITLFDDLLPASGNTWIIPDSVARVARELADHPEGVDFVSRPNGGIISQCERFHEVVGETGDVLLMHPLMMHSASSNHSGRIRWMGNPMVYLAAPLNPFRPVAELSPVELAIHRAINSR